jgi:hypothetical protein
MSTLQDFYQRAERDSGLKTALLALRKRLEERAIDQASFTDGLIKLAGEWGVSLSAADFSDALENGALKGDALNAVVGGLGKPGGMDANREPNKGNTPPT